MKRLCSVLLVLFMLVPAVAVRAEDGGEQRLESLLSAFMDSALWRSSRHENYVLPSRWTQPIRVRVDRDPDDELTHFVLDTLKYLADTAGVTVQVLPRDADNANFQVLFVDTDRMTINGEVVSCKAQHYQSGGNIDKVNVSINLNYKYFFRRSRCIRHEMMHGMGLFGHPHALDSILSYVYEGRDDFSVDDAALLTLLYDADLKPGDFHLPALLKARAILARRLDIQGDVSRLGRGVFEKQLERMKTAVAAGDSGMMVQLAHAYANGLYVDKDPGLAFDLYTKAAETGDAEAIFRLGYAHHKGEGAPLNAAEAVRLYRMAADKGHTMARNNLAVLVRDGNGTQADPVQAWALFDCAARQGNRLAPKNLEKLTAKLTPEQLVTAKALSQAILP